MPHTLLYNIPPNNYRQTYPSAALKASPFGGRWEGAVSLLLLLLLLLLCLTSCKPRRPDDVVSAKKIENVLYDYHMALALADTYPDSTEQKRALFTAEVLKNHGLTQEEFERSMTYYCRNAEELFKIYERLQERYDAEMGLAGQGSLVGEVSGDTLGLWGKSFELLSSQGRNRLQFSLAADTLLQNGDDLILDLSTDWYYHEGHKRLCAQLFIVYEGDSVVSTSRSIETTGPQTLKLHVGPEKAKRLTCILYQDAPWDERPRMVALRTPRLLRVRKHVDPTPEAPADSTATDTTRSLERALRDSLLHADTARTDHFAPQQ